MRASSRWLAASVATTIIVGALVISAFALALGARAPLQGAPHVPEPASRDDFVIAYTRLPGGHAEWVTYSTITELIGRTLDRPIKIRYVKGAAQVRDLFESGEIDAAFLSVYGYLVAADGGLVDIAATPVIEGHEREAAVVVVRADGVLRSLKDSQGTALAVSDASSIGGYGYLAWRFAQEGLTLDSWFGRIDAGASQEENLRRLASAEVDVTCVNRSQLASWPAGTFLVLDSSPEFGMPPFVVSKRLDEPTRNAILAVFAGLKSLRDLRGDSEIDGFAETHPEDYAFARVIVGFCEQHCTPVVSGEFQ